MLPVIATDDEDLYITGDTHFGHANIIKYCHRPFLGPEDARVLESQGGRWHDGSWKGPKQTNYKISPEGVKVMDDTLIANINATVPADGHLIHVGDWSMAPKNEAGWQAYADRCRAYRERINCRKISALWGNHDVPDMIANLFHWSGFVGKIEVKKLNIAVVACHYAFLVWDESHRGAINIYGHTHSEIEKYADELMGGRRGMDVGVDNAARLTGAYRPFRLQEILDLMDDRGGYALNPNTPKFSRAPREHAG